MKYKISNLQAKTASTGKNYKTCTLTDEQGVVTEKVSVWPEDVQYELFIEGQTVSGDINTNDKGYKNFKSPQAPKTGGGGAGVKAAQERKAEFIGKTLDRKENGVTLSATFRDATSITIAQFTGRTFTDEEFQTKWKIWRSWLLQKMGDLSDITETQDPLKDN